MNVEKRFTASTPTVLASADGTERLEIWPTPFLPMPVLTEWNARQMLVIAFGLSNTPLSGRYGSHIDVVLDPH